MIKRNLEPFVRNYAQEYPVISIVGPRQSGKTTLARYLFQNYRYVSLENLDARQMAENDPRGFLSDFSPPVIIDEIQRVPLLFSYLQEIVDTIQKASQYVLTGSQQFLLMENISQSLAGRIINFRLYPFSYNELYTEFRDRNLGEIFTPNKDIQLKKPELKTKDILFTGFYPRIHDKNLTPRKWIENYVLTYIERDIRLLVNVNNLRTFENFLSIVASNSAQLLNYATISNAVGITIPTVKKWISLLETSGIIFILPPHHKNFKKRVVKTPKIYFVDSGILCFLLGIRNPDELIHHPLFGNIFETFIVAEFYKRIFHIAEIPPLFFWRDKTGNEIDLILETENQLFPIEIKSSQTYASSLKNNISYWMNLKGNTQKRGIVIYNGNQLIGGSKNISVSPWWYF